MANKKVRLKKGSDAIYPRTTVDNIVTLINGSTESLVGIPVLDGNNKIPSSYLPSYVDDVVDFTKLYESDTAATTDTTVQSGQQAAGNPAGEGKKYIIQTTMAAPKIYSSVESSGTWSWDTAHYATVEKDNIYVETSTGKIYRYSGSNNMIEISNPITIENTALGSTDADKVKVPSVYLVNQQLGTKQNTITDGTGLTFSGNTLNADSASTSAPGIVQLTNEVSTNSNSSVLAVTPKGVADYVSGVVTTGTSDFITCEDIS